MNCDTARIYAGAVADGELDAVPAGILEHIRACHDCSTEVQWQREAQAALAGTLAAGRGGSGPGPQPAAEAALGQAAHAYGSPAGFTSSDPAAISGWSTGRGMPVEVMAIPDALPTGARVSTIEGHAVVTVIYTGAHGLTEVTMIPASMAGGWPAMEAMKSNHHPVGLVHRGADGVIVVTPDDGVLHAAMTALQAA